MTSALTTGVRSKAFGVLFPMVPYFDVSFGHMLKKIAVYWSQVEVPIDTHFHDHAPQNNLPAPAATPLVNRVGRGATGSVW